MNFSHEDLSSGRTYPGITANRILFKVEGSKVNRTDSALTPVTF